MIIVSDVEEYDAQQVLRALGLKGLDQTGEATLDGAIYPQDNSVYLGLCKGHLIITVGNDQIINESLQSSVGSIEGNLSKLFPNSEICTLSLVSIINHWGYALTHRGIKIRARTGDADQGTVVDFGEPLAEELGLLNQSRLDETGQRVYWLTDFPNDPMSEAQVGESFVFALFSRYFRQPLDESDALHEALSTRYSPSSIPKKRWWEFWNISG